jgi:hypothetical protein
VARRRTTFGKLQRDRDKQAKQKAKIERRAERAEASTDEDETETPVREVDQEAILAALAELHAAYDDGQISLDDFEIRRDELRNSLQVD